MDKIKKYLQEIEGHLSTDTINDDVWKKVQQGVTHKRSFWNKIQATINTLVQPKRLIKKDDSVYYPPAKNAYRYKWALAVLLPAFLIFSCTYRIDKVEVIGSLISFNAARNNAETFETVASLERLYHFSSVRVDKGGSAPVSFIGFIKSERNAQTLRNEIGKLPFVSSVKLLPVRAPLNESLFSAFVYKVFKTHVDERRPGKEEQQKNIQLQVDKMGFPFVKIAIDKEGISLAMDKGIFPPVEPQHTIVPAIKDTISAPAPTDTAVSKIKEKKRDTINSVIKEVLNVVTSVSEKRKWIGQLKGGLLTLTYYASSPATTDKVVTTKQYKLSDIGITSLSAMERPKNKYQFRIKSNVGAVNFTIAILNTNSDGPGMVQDAAGTYVFEEDEAFKEYLIKNGITDPSIDLILLCFLTGTDEKGIKALKDKGVAKNADALYAYLQSTL